MAGRVLIAEDDDDVLETIQLNLELEGFEVHVARDGDQALAQARAVEPDLILLDVVMPGPDGIAVARKLKDDPRTRDVPVIFLTAKSTASDAAVGLAAGADDYIVKPFDPLDLVARVRRGLSGQRGEAT
jgi:DNA-binding response OmpR family regulator